MAAAAIFSLYKTGNDAKESQYTKSNKKYCSLIIIKPFQNTKKYMYIGVTPSRVCTNVGNLIKN